MQSNRSNNKTQCPHCFTIYQISEVQLAQSKGNVRCGNCHERFKAQLLSDSEIKQARRKVTPNNDLFSDADDQASQLQPTTSNSDNAIKQVVRSVSAENDINRDLDNLDKKITDRNSPNNESDTPSERAAKIDKNPFKDLSLERRTTEDVKRKAATRSTSEGRKEPVFDFELEDSELELPTFGTKSGSNHNADTIAKDLDFVFSETKNNPANELQSKFSEPSSLDVSEPSSTNLTDQKVQETANENSKPVLPKDNQKLISEIDRIIDNRLVGKTDSVEAQLGDSTNTRTSEKTVRNEPNADVNIVESFEDDDIPVREINWNDEISHDDENSGLDDHSEDSSDVTWAEEDDLFVEPSDKASRKNRGALSLLQFILTATFVIGLIGLLGYQMWLKQFGFVRNNESAQTALNSIFIPSLDYLEGYGVSLNRPKNLVGIALISAQSEPHPSRPSTTLMKVSFLNKSSIEQSLPWLELSLTDESGKIVARRSLQPADYLFNNATQARIGPHELKKITIELLTFPKSATGFELKMLKSMSS